MRLWAVTGSCGCSAAMAVLSARHEGVHVFLHLPLVFV